MATKTTEPTTRDRLFEAANEYFDAMFAAVKATEGRGHKVSQALIAEAQQEQREFTEVARQWVDAPTHLTENLTAMLEAQTRVQERALDIIKDTFGGAGDYRAEMQDAVQRMIKANADAGRATVEVARDAYTRVRHRGEEEPRKGTRATRVPVAAATDN
jgi:hypothetical protein